MEPKKTTEEVPASTVSTQTQVPTEPSMTPGNTNNESVPSSVMNQVSGGLAQPVNSATPTSHTTIAIILLLLFYPAGIVYMWFATKWPKWLKILLTVFFILSIIITVFLIAALILINPAQQFSNARDAQRRSDVTFILNGVSMYKAAHDGQLPSSITTAEQEISKNGADLCADLVPAYMVSLPVDLVQNDDPIVDCTSNYNTNYTIQILPDGKIKVAAPQSEFAEVSVSR